MAFFETPLNFGVALGHGFSPSAVKFRVSESKGHEILFIDNQPACEQLASRLNIDQQKLTTQHITLTTGCVFGVADPMEQYSVNVASFSTPTKGVRPLAASVQ